MTEDEIKEGNKVIASFMDVRGRTNSQNDFVYTILDRGGITRETGVLYHYSWDWLMPVVEKIENTCKAHVCIYNKTCWIEFYGVHIDPPKFEISGNPFIENVFQCVVEFIKWYKAHNK